MKTPSIFNDVIGPVMRGPSSSHCAAALRIGKLCRDLVDAQLESVLIEFDPKGALATTHVGHGSDMGLFGGLLGWETIDERLPDAERAIREAGIGVTIDIVELPTSHPNTYRITLKNCRETRQVVALSTGGGMIEVVEIDGARVSMAGDCFETIVYVGSGHDVIEFAESFIECDEVAVRDGPEPFVEIKSRQRLSEDACERLQALDGVVAVRRLSPVLPVLSPSKAEVPFSTCEGMLAYNRDKGLELWKLAVRYESARGDLTDEEVCARMEEIVVIVRASIQRGMEGTAYEDRILSCQSMNLARQMTAERLIGGDALIRIIAYVTSMMEVKSSMGVIVAAPTAGSCGALPGAILALAPDDSDKKATEAMLAAGMIGVFIATGATFAAEVGGCQAECGSASGMAAAAIVGLAGGTLQQALSAASMALQNSLGLICDPIANRVEAPCLGRNVQAATNALSCANMALADYDALIPLDQVIQVMNEVGRSIAPELRCTSLGGLSITPASRAIESRLNG